MPVATQLKARDTFYLKPITQATTPLRPPKPIDYPETDGKPMADSDFQRNPLTYLLEGFKAFYEDNHTIYVSGDLLIYYEKDNPQASVAPDVFIVFDVHKHDRRIYQTWKEGKFPDVVFEIASKSTYKKDEIEKPELYRRLGVQEYFQYDPVGDCFQPQLRGRFLDKNGQYKTENPVTETDGSLRLISRRLGIELRLEGKRLRVFDPKTQQYLLDYSEEVKLRKQTSKQAEQERQRAEQERQQKELALQQAEQERQQKELVLQQAEQECQQKELALQQAEQERQQKEVAQLKAKKMAERLRALGFDPDEII